jgi:hypothetical protein
MMLILTIGALFIAMMLGVVDKAKWKWFYFTLYFSSFVLAGYTAVRQERSARAEKAVIEKLAQQRQAKLEADLALAHEKLGSLAAVEEVTNALVGDLAKLAAVGGDGKYYVRVAADRSRAGLAPYLHAINAQFAGAQASGLVDIREPRSSGGNYQLVFGQHLNLVAAEVFQRLAMSHRFPPKDQVAAIVKE